TPVTVLKIILLSRSGLELVGVPALERECHSVTIDVDAVEALLLVAESNRRRGPSLDDQSRTRPRHEVASTVRRRGVVMAREQHIDPRICSRIEGKLAS